MPILSAIIRYLHLQNSKRQCFLHRSWTSASCIKNYILNLLLTETLYCRSWAIKQTSSDRSWEITTQYSAPPNTSHAECYYFDSINANALIWISCTDWTTNQPQDIYEADKIALSNEVYVEPAFISKLKCQTIHYFIDFKVKKKKCIAAHRHSRIDCVWSLRPCIAWYYK